MNYTTNEVNEIDMDQSIRSPDALGAVVGADGSGGGGRKRRNGRYRCCHRCCHRCWRHHGRWRTGAGALTVLIGRWRHVTEGRLTDGFLWWGRPLGFGGGAGRERAAPVAPAGGAVPQGVDEGCQRVVQVGGTQQTRRVDGQLKVEVVCT